MHAVFVTGVIVVPLCVMWILIAEGWHGLRHPLDFGRGEPDRASVARAGVGWRFYFRVRRAERIFYRLGLAGGVICLAIAVVASLVSR